MPSTVYFGSVQHGNRSASASLAAKVDEIVRRLDLSTIDKKDKVAIKMHLGYADGYQTVPVFFVRRIVEAIKKTGAYPFITDNPTSVYNAVNRGYTQETCGCPLIPIAGVKDNYVYETKIGVRGIDTLAMCGVLHDADALIDLSHVKGHNSCGFGGAIKNIAIGGYNAGSRWRKYHTVWYNEPYWDPTRCTPEHAERLVESCPDRCITYNKERHTLRLSFDMCNQCMECIKADEGVGCLHLSPSHFSSFQELLVHGAKAVLDTFERDKCLFINFLLNITAYCDCWGFGQPPIVNDIGVLGSRDIVAIETASLDLIAKEGLIEKNIPPYLRPDLRTTVNLHPFARIHGPMKDPYIAIAYAVQLGLGSREYELVEVLSPAETMSRVPPRESFEDEPTFY